MIIRNGDPREVMRFPSLPKSSPTIGETPPHDRRRSVASREASPIPPADAIWVPSCSASIERQTFPAVPDPNVSAVALGSICSMKLDSKYCSNFRSAASRGRGATWPPITWGLIGADGRSPTGMERGGTNGAFLSIIAAKSPPSTRAASSFAIASARRRGSAARTTSSRRSEVIKVDPGVLKRDGYHCVRHSLWRACVRALAAEMQDGIE